MLMPANPSLTRYRVLSYDPEQDSSRVELEPVTGRSHQLRVHLMAIGHPILGDELYAPPHLRQQAGRLLLHACELAWVHPVSGQPLRCVSRGRFLDCQYRAASNRIPMRPASLCDASCVPYIYIIYIVAC